MREHKYRGMSKNGWAYGLLHFNYGQGEYMITHSNGWQPSYSNPDEGESTEFTVIDAETIGQYTGLQDCEGKDIYEGDNLRLTNGKFWWTYVVSTIPNNRTSTLYAVEVKHNVTSEDDRYTYEISDSRKGMRSELEFLDCKRLEVTGNIHEEKS